MEVGDGPFVPYCLKNNCNTKGTTTLDSIYSAHQLGFMRYCVSVCVCIYEKERQGVLRNLACCDSALASSVTFPSLRLRLIGDSHFQPQGGF